MPCPVGGGAGILAHFTCREGKRCDVEAVVLLGGPSERLGGVLSAHPAAEAQCNFGRIEIGFGGIERRSS